MFYQQYKRARKKFGKLHGISHMSTKRKRKTWKKGKAPRRGPGPSWKRTRLETVVAEAVAAAGVKPELKFHDVGIIDAAIAGTGTIVEDSCLTIPEGTTESTRIGRKITVHQIGWRFAITKIAEATAANDTSCVVRLLVYLDKQTNGAAAGMKERLAATDILRCRCHGHSGE